MPKKMQAHELADQVLAFRVSKSDRALVSELARIEGVRASGLLRRLLVAAVAARLSEVAGTPKAA